MSARSDRDLMAYFEQERPEWRSDRAQLWTQALELLPRIQASLVQQVSLYDSLLETPALRLIDPYRVIVCSEEPADVAARKGLTPNSVHKAVSRFRERTEAHFEARMTTLQRLARPS
jgi:hypothetical protein